MKPSLVAIIFGLAVLGLVESRPEMNCVWPGDKCFHHPSMPKCCQGSKCVGRECGGACGTCAGNGNGNGNWWEDLFNN